MYESDNATVGESSQDSFRVNRVLVSKRMFRFALTRPADLTRLTARHVDQLFDRANDNEKPKAARPTVSTP